MTWLLKGTIIHGIAVMDDDWQKWKGGSLVVDASDARERRKWVTVFHEHVTDRIDPRWFYTNWYNPNPFPTNVQLEDNNMLFEEQAQVLRREGKNPVEDIGPFDQDDIFGMYLGKWFRNPISNQRENRVILVLHLDRTLWVPIIE